MPGIPGPMGRVRTSAHVSLPKGSRAWLCNTRVLLICTYWIWRHRWSAGTCCESKRNDSSNSLWPDLQSLVKQVSAYSRCLIQTDAWSCPFLSIKSIAFLPDWTKRLILLLFVTSYICIGACIAQGSAYINNSARINKIFSIHLLLSHNSNLLILKIGSSHKVIYIL